MSQWSDEELAKMAESRAQAEALASAWKVGDMTDTPYGPAKLVEEEFGGFLVAPVDGGAPFRMENDMLRRPAAG